MTCRDNHGRKRILARPIHTPFNPYNRLFYDSLKAYGWDTEVLNRRTLWRWRGALCHYHWPEQPLLYPQLHRRLLGWARLFVQVQAIRQRRHRIVWTVHNIVPHERHGPAVLEAGFYRWWVRQVDGAVYLSESTRQQAEARYPDLRAKGSAIIPHGHYRALYTEPVPKDMARRQLQLPEDALILGCFGMIKPYKNIPQLIDAFNEGTADDNVFLVVAGAVDDRELKEAILQRAAGNARVTVCPRFLEDDQLPTYMAAIDAVVQPYRFVTNSGSALLALSLDRPVVVPAMGSMPELRDLVGQEWIYTYCGELGPHLIADIIEWCRQLTRTGRPDLSSFSWSVIGEKADRFFSELLPSPGSEVCTNVNGRK